MPRELTRFLCLKQKTLTCLNLHKNFTTKVIIIIRLFQSPSNLQTMKLWLPLLVALVVAQPNFARSTPGAPEDDIKIEPFQGYATISQVGSVYPELSYAHLILPIKIADVRQWSQLLQCLTTHWQHLLEVGRYNHADKAKLIQMAVFSKDIAQSAISRLEHVANAWNLNISHLPYEHGHPIGPQREKRQALIAGVAALAGWLGRSLFGAYSDQEMMDIVDQKIDALRTAIEDNANQVARNKDSLKMLNRTITILVEQVGKNILNLKKEDMDLLMIRQSLLLTSTASQFRDLVQGLDRARMGSFDLHLADIETLAKALDQLEKNAATHGKTLAISNVNDLANLDVSTWINRTSEVINVITHIPIKDDTLTLYHIVVPPMELSPGVFAVVDTEDQYLAINQRRTLHQTLKNSDLAKCKTFGSQHYCPDTVLVKSTVSSCSLSLFHNRGKSIRQDCDHTIRNVVADARRINTTTFLVTETTPTELSVYCKSRLILRKSISGSFLVSLPAGCTGSTEHLTFTRERFEISVTTTTNFGTVPMVPEDILPEALDDTWIQTARSYLRNVGRAIPASQVTTITRLEHALKQIDQTHSNRLFHLFTTIASNITLVALGLLVVYLLRRFWCHRCCRPTIVGHKTQDLDTNQLELLANDGIEEPKFQVDDKVVQTEAYQREYRKRLRKQAVEDARRDFEAAQQRSYYANHDPATGLEPEGHATVDSSRANAAFVRGFREGRQD